MAPGIDQRTNKQSVSASRVIDAPAATIFTVITDVTLHPVIDGSGSVRSAASTAPPLQLGSKFAMNMRIGVPYRMSSTVVEFQQDRLIAWQHLGHHRWRYELREVEGGTEVTETFDWSMSRAPKLLELIHAPTRNLRSIEQTLERLDAFVTNRAHAF